MTSSRTWNVCALWQESGASDLGSCLLFSVERHWSNQNCGSHTGVGSHTVVITESHVFIPFLPQEDVGNWWQSPQKAEAKFLFWIKTSVFFFSPHRHRRLTWVCSSVGECLTKMHEGSLTHKLSMMAHTYNASTQEVEIGWPEVQGYSHLHSQSEDKNFCLEPWQIPMWYLMPTRLISQMPPTHLASSLSSHTS